MRRALSWFGDWPDGSWFVFGVLGSGLTGMSAAQTATYSDYLPSAVAPRPPTLDADVPPERLLRRLWLVWAELAFDQSGGMRSGSFMGWMLLLALEAGLALLVGAFLATGDLTAPDRAAAAPILVWLVIRRGAQR